MFCFVLQIFFSATTIIKIKLCYLSYIWIASCIYFGLFFQHLNMYLLIIILLEHQRHVINFLCDLYYAVVVFFPKEKKVVCERCIPLTMYNCSIIYIYRCFACLMCICPVVLIYFIFLDLDCF